MTRPLLALSAILFFSTIVQGQQPDSTRLAIDQIEKSLSYKTGVVQLESDNATLTVPKGFKFLDKSQSIYVLTDLWGNPADSSILGMLFPINKGVLDKSSWGFSISFDPMGYVKDDDADDIDYDDLLKEQQEETAAANPERIKEGYLPIEFVGWASPPFYDQNKKILHWAKELKFGQDSLNTLNYNLRILGRKGVFVINAIGTMDQMPEIKPTVASVVESVKFKDGHEYADYVPDVDEVAAWTVGGLVAGKVLAKVGFFVLLAKFWKVIALAIAGISGPIIKFFKRKKDDITPAAAGDDTTAA